MKGIGMMALVACMLVAGQTNAQIGDRKATGDVRVKRLLDQTELKYEIDSDGDFKLINSFDNGRTQILFVNSNTERFLNMEIREVWSVGYISPTGVIPSTVALDLLRANSKIKLGAWQITKMGGKDVAVFAAKIAADTDVKTLLGTMQLVSEAADEKEAEITKKDDL
jgi:hypothetical protein